MKLKTLLFLIVISYLEYRLLMILHSDSIQNQLLMITSPLEGQAWWRAFQNRLLSGIIVNAIGIQVFYILTVFIKNFLFFKLTNDVKAVLIFVGLFCLFQDSRWLIAWDMLDVIFIILMLIIYDRKLSIWYYVALFSVAIFNRESALFIPLFMLINGYVEKKSRTIPIWMLAAGIILTLFLRESFTGSVQTYIGQDLANQTFGNHFYLMENVKSFFKEWMPKEQNISLIPAIVLVAIFFVKDKTVMIWLLCVFTITITVGVIHETRVWLLILPALIKWNLYEH